MMPNNPKPNSNAWFCVGALLVTSLPLCAQTPPPEKGTVEAGGKFVPKPSAGEPPNAPAASRTETEAAWQKEQKIERLESGKIRIGLVTLDQAARSVRFTATVNMVKGPVEYAVVAENGKLHESVFVTKASLRDIHVAMLLLGVKPSEANAGTDRALQVPESSAIRVTVEWETNGPLASHPLSSMIALADGAPGEITKRTLPDGVWLYQGSAFDAAGFVALREGSVVALIGDHSALVNNIGKDRDRDDIHVPNAALLPKQGMPVSIVFTYPPKSISAGLPAPSAPKPILP